MAGVPAGFVRLTQFQYQWPVYLAVNEISRFLVYDRFRPVGSSVVVTSDGSRHHVTESVERVAELIDDALTAEAVNRG